MVSALIPMVQMHVYVVLHIDSYFYIQYLWTDLHKDSDDDHSPGLFDIGDELDFDLELHDDSSEYSSWFYFDLEQPKIL